MREKGLTLPLILVILVLVATIVGTAAYFQLKPKPPKTRPTQTVTGTTPSQVPSQTPPQQTIQPFTKPTPTVNQSQNQEILPTQSPSAQNSGISVSIFCIDKIYEKLCGNVGGVVVKTIDGTEVARQKSNESGQFKVFLNPGDYRVVPMPGTSQYPIINSEPSQVTVNQDQLTEVKLSYWDGRR